MYFSVFSLIFLRTIITDLKEGNKSSPFLSEIQIQAKVQVFLPKVHIILG